MSEGDDEDYYAWTTRTDKENFKSAVYGEKLLNDSLIRQRSTERELAEAREQTSSYRGENVKYKSALSAIDMGIVEDALRRIGQAVEELESVAFGLRELSRLRRRNER